MSKASFHSISLNCPTRSRNHINESFFGNYYLIVSPCTRQYETDCAQVCAIQAYRHLYWCRNASGIHGIQQTPRRRIKVRTDRGGSYVPETSGDICREERQKVRIKGRGPRRVRSLGLGNVTLIRCGMTLPSNPRYVYRISRHVSCIND